MSRMYEFGFTVVHYLIGINYIHLILWFLAVKVAFIYIDRTNTKSLHIAFCFSDIVSYQFYLFNAQPYVVNQS